jgi:hypothetical protein
MIYKVHNKYKNYTDFVKGKKVKGNISGHWVEADSPEEAIQIMEKYGIGYPMGREWVKRFIVNIAYEKKYSGSIWSERDGKLYRDGKEYVPEKEEKKESVFLCDATNKVADIIVSKLKEYNLDVFTQDLRETKCIFTKVEVDADLNEILLVVNRILSKLIEEKFKQDLDEV